MLLAFLLTAFAMLVHGKPSTLSGAKFYNTPMHEVSQFPTYLGMSPNGEVVVTYSGKGADLHPDDYLTHADDVRVLTGSLSEFLSSGQREAAIPVVDDEDIKFGGSRLMGFVMIQSILPRKLQSRRGEIVFDLEEGGPAPDIQVGNVVIGGGSVKTVDDQDYKPPPHGGGRCITTRDCYLGNGTCASGLCACNGDYTGSYCQLYRPETGSISKMAKKAKHATQPGKPEPKPKPAAPDPNLPKPPPVQDDFVKVEYRKQKQEQQAQAQAQESETVEGAEGKGGRKRKPKPGARKLKPKPAAADGSTEGAASTEPEATEELKLKPKGKGKMKPKPKPEAGAEQKPPPQQQQQRQEPPPEKAQGGPLTEEQRMEAIFRLYGTGKAYPEPYLAGKVPREVVHLRHKSRIEKRKFVYSVRFRTGPFGLSFDNRVGEAQVK